MKGNFRNNRKWYKAAKYLEVILDETSKLENEIMSRISKVTSLCWEF